MKNKGFLKLLIGLFLLFFVSLFFDKPFLNAQNCIDNYQCEPEQYCKKQEGDCFGWGICSDKPSSSYYSGYDIMPSPVCGCNGITYPDSCEAAKSGVNVAYSGQCRTNFFSWINMYLTKYTPFLYGLYGLYGHYCDCVYEWDWYYYPYWENWGSQDYSFLQNWFYRFYPYFPNLLWPHRWSCNCSYGGYYGLYGYGGLYAGMMYEGY